MTLTHRFRPTASTYSPDLLCRLAGLTCMDPGSSRYDSATVTGRALQMRWSSA